MATIYQTPAKTWKAVIRMSGWPQQIKTFRTKRDAQDWARNVEDEMTRGVFISRAKAAQVTLSDALDSYLKQVTPTKKESTQAAEAKIIRQLRKTLGSYSLAAISTQKVSEYREARLAEGRAPDTVRLELTLLSNLFNVAKDEWQLGLKTNPVSAVKKPPSTERDRLLMWSEIKRLLKAAKADSQPMILHAIRIAMFTAMRHSELQNLRVQDVDFQKRLAFVHAKGRGRIKQAVPLSQRACKALKTAIDNPFRPRGSKYVFTVDGKKPYEIRTAWDRVVERAGIENVRFHDLRHLATTIYAKRGLTTQQLQQLTRHKTLSMLNRYTHLQASDIVDLL